MSIRLRKYIISSLLLLFFTSCSLQTSLQKCNKQDPTLNALAIQKLKTFSVDSIDIDYIAKCKARIVADRKSFSGSCKLVLTRNHELQLTILHPLGGTLLQFYADRKTIQVNDFTEKRYYEFPAEETDKLDIPILKDLSIDELQSILWGRLTKRAGDTLEYELEEGKPKKMYKRNSNLNLRIDFRRWLRYKSLQFPRIMDMTNHKNRSSLKLVITDFKPGYVCNLKLSNHFALDP